MISKQLGRIIVFYGKITIKYLQITNFELYICGGKHKIKIVLVIMYESKTMRNQELMCDYRRYLHAAMQSGGRIDTEEVINRVLKECTPRYDVSYDYARRMMHTMIECGQPCPAKGIKRLMWEEICTKVKLYMSARKYSLPDAITTVLREKRASRYFLSYKQAAKIIFYERTHRANCRA